MPNACANSAPASMALLKERISVATISNRPSTSYATAQRSISELARLDSRPARVRKQPVRGHLPAGRCGHQHQQLRSDIEDDPRRLADIEERLDLIARLKRKYGATIEEILQQMVEDRAELDTIINRDEMIATFAAAGSVSCDTTLGIVAQQLSDAPRSSREHLSVAMEEQLDDFNMKRARFSVEIKQIPDEKGVPASIDEQPEQYYACDLTGIDRIQFLIAPNPGEPFKPLTRIASGGETSRLMLALKTILSAADATPTLIFDEIDAGISGRSGQIVGEKLWHAHAQSPGHLRHPPTANCRLRRYALQRQ